MYCKDEDIDISETHLISENGIIKGENHSDIHSLLNKALKPSIDVSKIKQDAIKTDEFKFESNRQSTRQEWQEQDPSWQVHGTGDTNNQVQGDRDEKVKVKAERMQVTIKSSNNFNDDKSVIDLKISIDDKETENDFDSKPVPTLHHEINIEKTEDDNIFYLNKSDIGSESDTDHELVENSLDSDGVCFDHQDYESDSDSSPVFDEELKILLKDFLTDSRTGAKIKLRDFSIPLTREDSSGTRRVNVSRPEIPNYALMPMERYGPRTHELRIGPGSDLGRYRCHECPYETSKKHTIEWHVHQHAIIKPFKCSFCPKEYAKERSYIGHLWNDHRSRIPKLRQKFHYMFVPCSVCDYSTIESSKMKRHMRIHDILELER